MAIMTTAGSPTPLEQSLARVRRRLRATHAADGLGVALAAGVALLFAWMWVDLVLDLPPAARVAADWVALGGGIGLLVWRVARGWREGADERVARRLDATAGSSGEVLSGVDLNAARGRMSGMTAALAQIATERAALIAARVAPDAAVPAKRLAIPYATFFGLVVIAMVIAVLSPRLAFTQLARFFDPNGDHPPYSSIELAVDPGDVKVVYGSPLDVRVAARGGQAEKAELVLASTGVADQALPMFPDAKGDWQATVARVTSAGQYYVRAQGARSRRFRIDVLTVPKLERVKVRVTPPAYTHRAPYEGPVPQGGIAGLPGTKVEVWAKSNRPLASGGMRLLSSDAPPATQPTSAAPAGPVALKPAATGADEVAGSFMIARPAKYELRVTDSAGQTSEEAQTIPISVLTDQRPFVRILEPKPDSYATPDATLEVQILAEDDYGVSRLQLFRSLNASRTRPEEIPVPAAQPTRFPAAVPLKLDDYGLSPGDTVELFARVEDNDPAGAKGSESAIVTVKIISKQDLNRMLLTREGLEVLQTKYEQARRRLEAEDKRIEELEKELEKLDKNAELTPAQREALKKLADAMNADAKDIDRAAEDDLPFDLDKALKRQLGEASDFLKSAAGEAKETAARQGLTASAAKQAMEDMRQRLGARREEMQEEATAPLEHLGKIFPLIEDQARYLDLYQKQKDLAQRMEALRNDAAGGDDPRAKARMRDLEGEQRQLREELSTLLQDVEDHIAQLPDDERLDPLRQSARDFVDAVRASEASGQMSSAESSLGEFKGGAAQASAQAAADTLEQFIARCQGMGDQAGVCLKFQPKLAQGMGNTVEQLLEAEGLGQSHGKGQGIGAGGGYSYRRSSLRNVGLYGGLPHRGRMAGGPKGGSADKGAGTWDEGTNPDGDKDGSGGGTANSRASGAADPSVPAQYRKQVGDYFRRVADELGDK